MPSHSVRSEDFGRCEPARPISRRLVFEALGYDTKDVEPSSWPQSSEKPDTATSDKPANILASLRRLLKEKCEQEEARIDWSRERVISQLNATTISRDSFVLPRSESSTYSMDLQPLYRVRAMAKTESISVNDIMEPLRRGVRSTNVGRYETYSELRGLLNSWNASVAGPDLSIDQLAALEDSTLKILDNRIGILQTFELGDRNPLHMSSLQKPNSELLTALRAVQPSLDGFKDASPISLMAIAVAGFEIFKPSISKHLKGKLMTALRAEARLYLDPQIGSRKGQPSSQRSNACCIVNEDESDSLKWGEESFDRAVENKVNARLHYIDLKAAESCIREKLLFELKDLTVAHAGMRWAYSESISPIKDVFRAWEAVDADMKRSLPFQYAAAVEESTFIQHGLLPAMFELSKSLVARSQWLEARDKADLGREERIAERKRRINKPRAIRTILGIMQGRQEIRAQAQSVLAHLDQLSNSLQRALDAYQQSYQADQDLFEAVDVRSKDGGRGAHGGDD